MKINLVKCLLSLVFCMCAEMIQGQNNCNGVRFDIILKNYHEELYSQEFHDNLDCITSIWRLYHNELCIGGLGVRFYLHPTNDKSSIDRCFQMFVEIRKELTAYGFRSEDIRFIIHTDYTIRNEEVIEISIDNYF